MAIKYLKKVKGVSAPVRMVVAPSYGVDVNKDTSYFNGTKDFYYDSKWSYKTILNEDVNTHDIFGDGSCIATYNLDGDATDLGGNYNGTATSVTYGTGKFGQGAVFTSSNGVITTGITNNYPLTYSFFFIPNNPLSSPLGMFLGKRSGGTGFTVCISTNSLIFTNSGGVIAELGVPTEEYSGWTHCSVVISTSDVKVYINGTLSSSSNIAVEGNGYSVEFGRVHTNWGLTMSNFDQVRIFNRALTEAEVTRLYYEGLVTVGEYTTPQTYLNDSNGKLVGFDVVGGEVADIVSTNIDVPKISEKVIQADTLTTNKLMMKGMEAYACRAWVNFNGTGTVAIRASGNVSSITDNGVGDYTVNFTTAMTDVNYAASGVHNGSSQNCNPTPISVSTSAYRFATTGGAGSGTGVGFTNRDAAIITMEFTR